MTTDTSNDVVLGRGNDSTGPWRVIKRPRELSPEIEAIVTRLVDAVPHRELLGKSRELLDHAGHHGDKRTRRKRST